ncbi:hypothetical protein FQN52_004666 [Onygenales sp. PD_12]|nr:hypothetical protein FQN52_004666 [Onygenales sp. PD_12]
MVFHDYSAYLTLQESARTTHSKRPLAALLGPDNSTILLSHLSISHTRHAESELTRLASDHYPEPYLWRCTLLTGMGNPEDVGFEVPWRVVFGGGAEGCGGY